MRRTCEVIPRRTNTPLHALTLLNDVTALEAARTLAEKGWSEDPAMTAPLRLKNMFQSVLSREPSQREFVVLKRGIRPGASFLQSESRGCPVGDVSGAACSSGPSEGQ